MVLYESELRYESIWPCVVGNSLYYHLINNLPWSDEEVAAQWLYRFALVAVPFISSVLLTVVWMAVG